MVEYNAIKPDEMTTGTGLKIMENVSRTPLSLARKSAWHIIVIFDKCQICRCKTFVIRHMLAPTMRDGFKSY
jgi:hypothetical protein